MRRMFADRGMGEPVSLAAALLAGKKVGPDVTGLLMEDHRVVLGWFMWYDEAQGAKTKAEITHKICNALRAHMAAEEEIFYPEAQRATGDDQLIDRAVQEHQGAKKLMDRLEAATTVDAEHDDLVRELRAEIETHVHEEESQLFPEVRASEMDLFEVGRAVAARRVDRLFELVESKRSRPSTMNGQPIKEYPAMQQVSSDIARRYYVVGLKNLHATAKHGQKMADTQLKRLEHYPRLKQKLDAHVKEKDAQIARIERLLQDVGESPSSTKDAVMSLSANMSGMTSAAAGDEILKNSFAMLGLAKAEAAAYETAILFAEAAGLDEALRPLQQCLSEERGMAAFIEENLRGVGTGFLQLETQGVQAKH